jgi:hypothetical protein
MRKVLHLLIPGLIALSLPACVPSSGPGSLTFVGPGIPEDQKPMYGGMDRTRYRQIDAELIRYGTELAGSREEASRAWVGQAMRYYNAGNPTMAMRRLNQAWLFDSKNPELYWRFGVILRGRKDTAGAKAMMKRAHSLGLRDPAFLADYRNTVGSQRI